MPKTLTTDEVQARLGVGRTKLWRLYREGANYPPPVLKSTKVRGRRLISEASVAAFERAEEKRIEKELR